MENAIIFFLTIYYTIFYWFLFFSTLFLCEKHNKFYNFIIFIYALIDPIIDLVLT